MKSFEVKERGRGRGAIVRNPSESKRGSGGGAGDGLMAVTFRIGVADYPTCADINGDTTENGLRGERYGCGGNNAGQGEWA